MPPPLTQAEKRQVCVVLGLVLLNVYHSVDTQNGLQPHFLSSRLSL